MTAPEKIAAMSSRVRAVTPNDTSSPTWIDLAAFGPSAARWIVHVPEAFAVTRTISPPDWICARVAFAWWTVALNGGVGHPDAFDTTIDVPEEAGDGAVWTVPNAKLTR